jgi:HD-GYP domain-containing protein (c-di-GMP phosphodiesterase class II)
VKKTVVRPGRTIKKNERKEIAVSGLKVGMYVAELDRPWLETPFILQGFEIRSVEQIEEIAQHCEYVFIDETRDTWLGAEERVGLSTPTSKKVKILPTSGQKSYDNARSAYNNAHQLTRSFMDDVRLGRAISIQEVKRTVSELVKNMIADPGAMMWMSKLRNQDEYTAEHCLNVGMLAINFGRHLGASEDDLHKLGVSGMLHDIGKMRTPLEVLNKPDKLEPHEFKIMMAHPKSGRDILMSHKTVDHTAIDVAYGHHEMLDGSGYPRKIKASGISDFTRMVTLCDIYDAITSDRVYKKGQTSREALNILYGNRATKFDTTLVDKFVECIGLYPPGSIVELGSGEVGIVISINYRHRHLPKVMIIRDENKMPLREGILNLDKEAQKANQNKLIKSVHPNGSFGIRIESYIRKGLRID